MPTPAKIPYTFATLAKETGIRAGTLRVWAARGKMPAPDGRVGASPTWSPRHISQWLRVHRKQEADA